MTRKKCIVYNKMPNKQHEESLPPISYNRRLFSFQFFYVIHFFSAMLHLFTNNTRNLQSRSMHDVLSLNKKAERHKNGIDNVMWMLSASVFHRVTEWWEIIWTLRRQMTRWCVIQTEKKGRLIQIRVYTKTQRLQKWMKVQ